MDELNNIIQDENYFKKLDEKIKTTNNHCIDLENRLNKAIEYIEERYDYVLKDKNFLDHDELVDRKIALYLLKILKGE